MSKKTMTSMERVLTALSHKEPDRVPVFLLLTMHGAKELGMGIREYFDNPEAVAEGQIRMQKKYQNDCYYAFYYAPIETEAFGAEVIYSEDGPPNSGIPFIRDFEQIKKLSSPDVAKTEVLQKVFKTIEILNKESNGTIPIIGVAMSPFSLPVMQLGFDKYFDLMHFHPELFQALMQVNERFCVDWSNAQLAAGATAICYFDPVSSSSMIPPDLYKKTGFEVAKKTLAQIKGPTATHFASGNCLPIADLVAQTGTAVAGISSKEDLGALKNAFRNKLSLLGNLNGIGMRKWTIPQTEEIVKEVIRIAAPGGGFILSDNHGEIPYQVPDDVLLAVTEAVHRYGQYPIQTD
jgi:uroporphyrinogen decarboxylase